MEKVLRLYKVLGIVPAEKFANESKAAYAQRLLDDLPESAHQGVVNEVVRRVMNDLQDLNLEE